MGRLYTHAVTTAEPTKTKIYIDNTCCMCEERIIPSRSEEIRQITGIDGLPHPAHRYCLLRDAMGGIGHLIAHDYWCTEKGDPDAGLTRRQSARLVDAYAEIVGYG